MNKVVGCPICTQKSIFVYLGKINHLASYICSNCLVTIKGKDLLVYDHIDNADIKVTEEMRSLHFDKTGMYVKDEVILKWYLDHVKGDKNG